MKKYMNEAEAIVDRADRTGKSIAVFIINGSIKNTRTDTELFRFGCKEHMHAMAGIYDRMADPADVAEDIEAVMETLK